ncbi:hypothetical protein DSM106972_097710 [Dulcicalothrix desertica PCC 7102]|uniref:Uncharacterized protein n=1 Tax=Dulcicalothrix desertica PCC 7102 TaxID=232991 RepID=A0A3S1C082_9CYAN|nr:hypothetical protein [Dulcicalothrix desertica]RUS93023.1 hypothetical protein DSM106972_097710 [Dulcicalothrix desertica PCC 7102]TWH61356.1 hypothetical protein CAL7102_00903 [Dulcicalothrix desertica PCC 7102]
MARFRHDNFINELERLASSYPEYGDILRQLVVEIERGKIEKIRQLLQQNNYW